MWVWLLLWRTGRRIKDSRLCWLWRWRRCVLMGNSTLPGASTTVAAELFIITTILAVHGLSSSALQGLTLLVKFLCHSAVFPPKHASTFFITIANLVNLSWSVTLNAVPVENHSRCPVWAQADHVSPPWISRSIFNRSFHRITVSSRKVAHAKYFSKIENLAVGTWLFCLTMMAAYYLNLLKVPFFQFSLFLMGHLHQSHSTLTGFWFRKEP